jgi:hypothetical protein
MKGCHTPRNWSELVSEALASISEPKMMETFLVIKPPPANSRKINGYFEICLNRKIFTFILTKIAILCRDKRTLKRV